MTYFNTKLQTHWLRQMSSIQSKWISYFIITNSLINGTFFIGTADILHWSERKIFIEKKNVEWFDQDELYEMWTDYE